MLAPPCPEGVGQSPGARSTFAAWGRLNRAPIFGPLGRLRLRGNARRESDRSTSDKLALQDGIGHGAEISMTILILFGPTSHEHLFGLSPIWSRALVAVLPRTVDSGALPSTYASIVG